MMNVWRPKMWQLQNGECGAWWTQDHIFFRRSDRHCLVCCRDDLGFSGQVRSRRIGSASWYLNGAPYRRGTSRERFRRGHRRDTSVHHVQMLHAQWFRRPRPWSFAQSGTNMRGFYCTIHVIVIVVHVKLPKLLPRGGTATRGMQHPISTGSDHLRGLLLGRSRLNLYTMIERGSIQLAVV
jgi:hypothetical protein